MLRRRNAQGQVFFSVLKSCLRVYTSVEIEVSVTGIVVKARCF
jgi:hypothetical protein